MPKSTAHMLTQTSTPVTGRYFLHPRHCRTAQTTGHLKRVLPKVSILSGSRAEPFLDLCTPVRNVQGWVVRWVTATLTRLAIVQVPHTVSSQGGQLVVVGFTTHVCWSHRIQYIQHCWSAIWRCASQSDSQSAGGHHLPVP